MNKIIRCIALFQCLVLLPAFSKGQTRRSDFFNSEYSSSGKKSFRKLYQANEALLEKIKGDTTAARSLTPSEITGLFYHLKSKGCYIGDYNKEKRQEVINAKLFLITYASSIIPLSATPDTTKWEAMDFLSKLIESKCIQKVKSVDEILRGMPKSISSLPPQNSDNSSASLDPVLRERSGVEWTLLADSKEPLREKSFMYFLDNRETISSDSITIIADMCKAQKEYLRNVLLLSEKARRMPGNKKVITELAAGLMLLPRDLYSSIETNISAYIQSGLEKFSQDSVFAVCYSDLLMKNEKYNEAVEFLKNAIKNPRTKFNCYQAIYRSKGLESAIDYLFSLKARSSSIERILFDLNKELSNEKVIGCTRYLKAKYATALDTINITTLGGYWREKDGNLVKNGKLYRSKDEQGIFYLIELYAKSGYQEESFDLQDEYWQYNRPTPEEIDKQVSAKKMSAYTAGSLLLAYGQYCVEDEANGSRNRELIQSKCLPLLLKAYKYDPNNYDVCKQIGFAYSYLGDGNKRQTWLNRAASLGADMRDASGAGKGKGNIQRGSRGGKYYINSNGNKTYVK